MQNYHHSMAIPKRMKTNVVLKKPDNLIEDSHLLRDLQMIDTENKRQRVDTEWSEAIKTDKSYTDLERDI